MHVGQGLDLENVFFIHKILDRKAVEKVRNWNEQVNISVFCRTYDSMP